MPRRGLGPEREANGKFEPGGELWLINANGKGEPTRLTYNHSLEYGIDWWAEPTLEDVDPGYWALCEINACVEAGIVAGYDDGSYHGDWPADPATMAVYVARAFGL